MHVPLRVIRPHSEWHAAAPIPTRFGEFMAHVFLTGVPSGPTVENVALVYGDITGKSTVPIRVHSECLTSEVFGSLKCDCKEQLEAAQEEIAQRGAGAVLYLRQEGRGIGLVNKIRAYELQHKGADTVDANRLLGLPDDAREYHAAADMLAYFRVQSVELLTNNPAKVDGLRSLGVEVVRTSPVLISPNPHSAKYLETKRQRMAHALPEDWHRAVGNAE